jgi:DeoR family transcriptional regulator of aga operon
VLSATAVTAESLWGTNALDAAIKRILADQADTVILLADGTKLGGTAPLLIARLGIVDVIVTDERADPMVLDAIASGGVTVKMAR